MGKREYSTKTQRTDLLNKLGFAEAEMQEFWDECIPVNHKIANLSKAGYNWTNLSLWQIGQLPTLKEKTLKEKEKQEKKEKKEKEAAEKKKYYVKISTYKKVKGKKYYSSWSKMKEVRIK